MWAGATQVHGVWIGGWITAPHLEITLSSNISIGFNANIGLDRSHMQFLLDLNHLHLSLGEVRS